MPCRLTKSLRWVSNIVGGGRTEEAILRNDAAVGELRRAFAEMLEQRQRDTSDCDLGSMAGMETKENRNEK